MASDKVLDALNVLRAEHDDAKAEVARIEGELVAANLQVKRIATAVESLEELVGETPTNSGDTRGITNGLRLGNDDTKHAADVSDRVTPYVQPNGNRLRSKIMIFDLLNKIGEPVTRDELKKKFFEYYGRNDIERFWKRPDNVLNTALDRAMEDDVIIEVPGDLSGEPTYTAGFMDRSTGRPAMYRGEDD